MTVFKHLDVEERDDVSMIRLADPKFFDTNRYAALQQELVEFIEQKRPRKLIVDFCHVEYCSTAIMSTLLLVQDRVESDDGLMKTCGMNDTVREAFERLKLDRTAFDIYTSRAAALDAF